MASISTQKGSSSLPFSSSTPQWKYHVFLSFRGEDIHNGFTDHLYAALKQKGIVTFRDEEKLERGKSISLELLEAIEKSEFAIVILSRNYASSTWCLDELAKIIECMKEIGTIVWPIFYDVDPSNVRKQTGSFAQAFATHEEHFKDNIEKVQTWRATLKEVANLKGWHLQDRSESKFIQTIVGELWHKLSYAFLEDTKDLVGIESRVKKLESCLAMEFNDIRIVGVWGMGGIGKTTLARVVSHMVAKKYEGYCFLANVREVCEKDGLVPLQQQLISQILNERMNIQDVDEGVFVIENRFRHKRILLVIDDVNQLDQLKKLAGKHNWFGLGSRVIITTRDKHLLHILGVDEMYEIEGLDDDEALHLLSLKAFHKDHPPKDYLELSKDVVKYTKGLPLAIEILGSFLFSRSINQWKSTLNRLTEYPEREILQVLKISYDGLHEIEKKIFLYIACFFNHWGKDSVVKKLDYLGLYPDVRLGVLVDNSLIKMNDTEVWMHDLLKEMGRKIVLEESPEDPGRRSSLWSFEDINNVLTKNTGTGAIQAIVLELLKSKEADWNPESFSKMHHLKLLIIHNVQLLHEPKHLPNGLRFLDWSGYRSKSLPLNFQSNELIELHMCSSYIERLWKGAKGLSLDNRYDIQDFNWLYVIILPGSVIPKWFSHQSMGAEVTITVPSCYLCDELMGIAVCVVFCSLPHHQIDEKILLKCLLMVNGKETSSSPLTSVYFTLSDHIWLLYVLPQYFMDDEDDLALLKECEANECNQFGIKIVANSALDVKECGFRMVYKKDMEDPYQTMAQSSNTSIIPYEDVGVLHHNFDNSVVVAEGNKAKRTRDDYDGVGPSGDGSSNDVPHPKRIERLTEFNKHGNSDCAESSEYKD